MKLVEKFDRDGDNRLNRDERRAAREHLAREREEGRGPRRPGGGRGFGGDSAPPEPGAKLSSEDVKTYPGTPLYAPDIVRTFFLEFENKDWEKELSEFYRTDVEVPARLTVDGKEFRDVGVHFRGASSFFTVAEGRKRSLNLSVDFVHDGQNIGGYRTFNLLNSHTDPAYLRTVLYYQIAREYIPAPKANYVRVVINGENWGIYVNAQQFNKDLINDGFGTTKGARWKVPGSPRGEGGLAYLGEKITDYKRHYEIKTKDDSASWTALIELCRLLDQTPPDQMAKTLSPVLNIDGALRFLAMENVFINNDGYWVRASDYNLYRDSEGRFHLIPHDANETFRSAQGPGMGGGRGGPGRGPGQPPGGFDGPPERRPEGGRPPGFGGPGRGGSVELNPLAGASDPGKPLLSKLLAAPELKEQYLGYVREIAEKWLDWQRLEPIAQQHHALIAEDVKADTRKLDTFEAFVASLSGQASPTRDESSQPGRRGPGAPMSLKAFADQRRAFLLDHPELKKLAERKTSDISH